MTPSGSELADPLKLIGVPVGALVKDCANDAVGGASVIVVIPVALEDSPALSVTVTFTVKEPAWTYELLSAVVLPGRLSTVPSPQSTLRLVIVPSRSEEEIVMVIVASLNAALVVCEKPTVGPTSTTVMVTVLVCDSEPDDALTLTLYEPGLSEYNVRVETAELPGDNVKLAGPNEPVMPGEAIAANDTIPLNP